jgi:RHS repeat-associated protein
VVKGAKASDGNADIVQLTDYHEFGMTMQGRSFVSSNSYRFGYQGSEKDGEINSGAYTTEFRGLDVRLGRWLRPDPITHTSWSPYVSMNDNPIALTDVMGLEPGDESGCGEPGPEITTPDIGEGGGTPGGMGGNLAGIFTPPGGGAWGSLISFKPPQSTYVELNKRQDKSIVSGPYNRWAINDINNAYGQNVNIDIYTIKIDALPVIDGKKVTAEELQEYIRKNFNSFLDQNDASFDSYSDNDKDKWNSTDPLNAVMTFDVGGDSYINPTPWLGGNPDDLTVICTDKTTQSWTFTTIQSPANGQHPVSGNRKFGFYTDSKGGLTFYTKGADRLTGAMDAAVNSIGDDYLFSGADKLWKNYQANLQKFINSHGGKATIKLQWSKRYIWNK